MLTYRIRVDRRNSTTTSAGCIPVMGQSPPGMAPTLASPVSGAGSDRLNSGSGALDLTAPCAEIPVTDCDDGSRERDRRLRWRLWVVGWRTGVGTNLKGWTGMVVKLVQMTRGQRPVGCLDLSSAAWRRGWRGGNSGKGLGYCKLTGGRGKGDWSEDVGSDVQS